VSSGMKKSIRVKVHIIGVSVMYNNLVSCCCTLDVDIAHHVCILRQNLNVTVSEECLIHVFS
jgi:hypothetical protein